MTYNLTTVKFFFMQKSYFFTVIESIKSDIEDGYVVQRAKNKFFTLGISDQACCLSRKNRRLQLPILHTFMSLQITGKSSMSSATALLVDHK